MEAYHGQEDLASHAHIGKTKRNFVMFQEGGYWYIYLCYGMHFMLNLVTGEKDFPAAILIRGITGINGPGRLTRRLDINQAMNNQLIIPQSKLFLVDLGYTPHSIIATPRIGVSYAGEYVNKPWRFILND